MRKKITALTVKQWLPDWNQITFTPESHRRKPDERFLLLSLEATELRRLIGIQRRSDLGPRGADLGIQRVHERGRSKEIADYIHFGYPWSSISNQRRKKMDSSSLIKPGWLASAIIINIIGSGETRRGQSVNPADLITVDIGDDGTALIDLPDTSSPKWGLKGLPPLEVIDGQHRLYAFDELNDDLSGYQMPVVAFINLDISWQAYLFYIINIKPKKINPSLAFDLYPLLRTEDWLQGHSSLPVYREARSQELTEVLWSHPVSPWYQRINMLGRRKAGLVTQASWVRSLQATFVKNWHNPRFIGGLFGGTELDWSRPQQAAFLILCWLELAAAIKQSSAEWAEQLRTNSLQTYDVALAGEYTLLNSDIGVRGVLYIMNDLCYVRADEEELGAWAFEMRQATLLEAVSKAIESLKRKPVAKFISQVADSLASYDWRLSKAPDLTPALRQDKTRFRGGSGYRELRIDVLFHLCETEGVVGDTARHIIEKLGYER